jgi:hypothetical protein
MPVAWVNIPPDIARQLQPTPPVEAGVFQQYAIDENLTVEARQATLGRETAEFSQGVRAVYGPSILTADKLFVNRLEGWAQAEGNVVLTDPAGTIQAQNLRFSWAEANKSAHAENIIMEVEGVTIRAATADLIPGNPPRWVLTDIGGTSCPQNPPLYFVSSPKLEIVPGQSGRLERPRISLFGKHIATLPTRNFNLDPRVRGVGLPSLSIKRTGDVGITWEADFLQDQHTALTMDAGWFKGNSLTGDIRWTRTFLDPLESDSLIAPRSDFEERFREGYFNNINSRSPASEQKRLMDDRRILGIGGSLNFGTRNDLTDDRFTSAEVVYEVGGSRGQLAYQGALRGQYIRREDDPFTPRMVARGTLGWPTFEFGGDLYGRLRLDTAAYLGKEQFGWTRAESALIWAPNQQFMLGGALVLGAEYGEAMFPSDRLFTTQAMHFRTSVNLGPTKFSYLAKYDLKGKEWFDREYEISQIIGCLEGFVLYRQFPSSYNFGIRLRLNDFFRRLRTRSFERESEKPKPKDSRLFFPPE